MIKIPNLRHLIAFVAVVENNSISKASDKIFLSQPAITQAIAKIETNIKATLFDRKTDGMYLTPEGKIFYFRVNRALQLLRAEVKKLEHLTDKGILHNPKIYSITTTQLKALVAVTESKNYSAAGRSIGVSQSSLYRACKDLESYLDVLLFEKTTLGIAPTKTAQKLTQAVKLAFYEIKQAIEEIDSHKNIHSGSIIVGSLPLARTCILPTAINLITTTYPDINISVIDGMYEDLLQHLRYGELDVIIGALRFPPPSHDIHQEILFHTANVILARADHPLHNKQSISIQDLADYGWVISRQNTPTRRLFEELFEQNDHPLPKQIIEAGSQMLVKEVIIDSDKLTMLPQHQVHRELRNGEFKIIPFSTQYPERAIGITTRKNWQGTAVQENFILKMKDIGLALNHT